MWTSDDEYLTKQWKSWEETKNETRKRLPEIYKNSNKEIKTIISMLVESEFQNAIKQDNIIRRNARDRNETTKDDKYADTYLEENKEIFELMKD